jgi:hypothetical protein
VPKEKKVDEKYSDRKVFDEESKKITKQINKNIE